MNTRTAKLLLAILIVFMTLTVVNVVVHLFKNEYVTETAVAVSASNSVTFNGVYVRDEEVLHYDGNGVISYAVNDGGRLSTGETAAYIYGDERQIQINKKIAKIDSEISILQKIQNPGTKEVAQPAYLASLIQEKYNNIIYYKEIGNLVKMASVKEELLIYLSTMQYVTAEVYNFSDKIASLEAEKTKLENEQVQPINDITASYSAYFASYVDGYEDILTFESVNKLTASQINNITDYDKLDTVKNAVGKLIKGYDWKLLGVVENGNSTFEENDIINLYFPSCAETFKGVVESVRDGDNANQKILTIVCTDMSYNVVQHRAETVEVYKENEVYNGIRIPRDAIRIRDIEETETDKFTGETHTRMVSTKGVYIKLGEKIVFKKIDVVFEGNDYVVSKVHADGGYVQLYDDTIVKGIELE